MAETYYSILTSIGKAQIANGIGLGTKVDFVKMKVGDGNGAYYNPTESQLDLVHTVWEGAIGHVAIDEDNPNWLNIEVLIPPDVGGFMIREYAVFDANNHMIAIAKCAETYKPLPSDGSTKEINMKMVLAVSNTSSITLKIDPSILFAKKSEVILIDNKIGNLSDLKTTNKTNIVDSINELVAQSSDMVYQTATGTGTAITFTIKGTLVNGYPITFIASANNSGATTTINGKPLYKPSTTTAPNLIAGKAYTVWYNTTSSCFFIKASAEGNVLASQVIKDKTFSNDTDTGLIGTLDLSLLISSNIRAGITINGVIGATNVVDTTISSNVATSAMLRSGYKCFINGVLTTGTATEKAAATITPTTTDQTIASGVITTGVQTIKGDANLLASNILSGISLFGIAGNVTGLKIAQGTVTAGSAAAYSGYTLALATVSGLTFAAKIVILVFADTNGLTYETVYNSVFTDSYPLKLATLITNGGSTSYTSYALALVSPGSISATGFTLPVLKSGTACSYLALSW